MGWLVTSRAIPPAAGEAFIVEPGILEFWREYQMTWRYFETRYNIVVSNPDRRSSRVRVAMLDGVAVEARAIPLVNDGQAHHVSIVLGGGAA